MGPSLYQVKKKGWEQIEDKEEEKQGQKNQKNIKKVCKNNLSLSKIQQPFMLGYKVIDQ